MDVVMTVFELTKRFSTGGKHSLTNQVRRSTRPVPADIAEAWRKRGYPAAFVGKLNDAEAEAAETRTRLAIARRCRYLNDDETTALDQAGEDVLAMLTGMASPPEKWTLQK